MAPRNSVVEALRDLAPHVNPPIANPTPLGLFAFSITTALLMCQKTRLSGNSDESQKNTEHLVWCFGIFGGGLAQLLAGLGEVKRNNVFAYTAFVSYGSFWLSLGLAGILSSVAGYVDSDTGEWVQLHGLDEEAMQALLSLWGLFTFVLWVCTFAINKTICALFFSLALAFFLLAAGVKNETAERAGGWVGMVAAGFAFWLGSLEIINDIVGGGKEVISPGHWPWSLDKHHGSFHAAGRIHTPHFHMALHRAGFECEVKHRLVNRASITALEKVDAEEVAALEKERGKAEVATAKEVLKRIEEYTG